MRRFLPFALVLLAIPAAVLAQRLPPDPALIPGSGRLGPTCNFITGEFNYECIPLYIAYLIKLLFGFAGGMCLTGIMQAGYELAFSGFGDRETAKKRIQNCLLGLALCIFAFLIVDTAVTVLLSGPTN